MRATVLLVLLGAALGNALPTRKRSIPSLYHRSTDNGLDSLVEDEYLVEFYPGYSLEEHFKFVGYNLSTKAENFGYMNQLNAYGVKTDKGTIHNVIRYDPGVYRVSHNMALHHADLLYSSRANTNHSLHSISFGERSTWDPIYMPRLCEIRMLNTWDKQNSCGPHPVNTNVLSSAGKGVDVYVLDHAMRSDHGVFRTDGGQRELRSGKKYIHSSHDYSHGTAVGGIVATNAPGATVVSAAILGHGGSTEKTLVAFNDIIEDHKRFSQNPHLRPGGGFKGSVINISWITNEQPLLAKALHTAMDVGIVVVAGSGNSGKYGVDWPCSAEGVICVGSVDKDYRVSFFSNYGPSVDVYAPGHEIYVADSSRLGTFHAASGTSLASPEVAAIVAHYISFEGINNNIVKVFGRLKDNWHEGILDQSAVPNRFAHSGLQHPKKALGCPYNGPRSC